MPQDSRIVNRSNPAAVDAPIPFIQPTLYGCHTARQKFMATPAGTGFVTLRVLLVRKLVESVLHVPRFVELWIKYRTPGWP